MSLHLTGKLSTMPSIQLIEGEFPLPHSVRAPGLHLSTVLMDYLTRVGAEKATTRIEGDTSGHGFMALGHAWEDYLRRHGKCGEALSELVVEGVPLNLDGITFTSPDFARRALDAYSRTGMLSHLERGELSGVVGGVDRVHEVKFTSRWKPEHPTDELEKMNGLAYWYNQFTAYAAAVGAVRGTRHVLWLCNHHGRVMPSYRVYEYTWGEEELEAVWAKVVGHKKFMEEEGGKEQ